MTTQAPGPGTGVLLQLRQLRREPLQYMREQHARYGDLVRLGAGRLSAHLIGHPDHADHVLRALHSNYDRETRSARAVRHVTGESIITNSGDTWREHRLLLQPAFHQQSVRVIAPVIADEAQQTFDAWGDGRELDFAAEMMHLTFNVAGRAFFGADLDDDARSLEPLLPTLFEETFLRSTEIIPLRRVFRPAHRRAFDAAMRKLDSVVKSVIVRGGAGGTVATMLAARDAHGNPRLDSNEIRNETIALLLAGHETTANALCWTMHLLTTHREALERAREEAASSSGDGVSADDAPFLSAVINEALRLFPPIWIVERRAIEEDEIDGFVIPARSIVYVSPYVLHRHADYWDDADLFRPERFLTEFPKRAFLPFGAGPHHCLGAHFATMEARMVLTMMLRRFEFEAVSGDVMPEAWITLRPRGGMRVRVVTRAEKRAVRADAAE